jgi:transposase-like protein
MPCPRCAHTHCIKNGKVEKRPRYKCKSCGFQFTRLTPGGYPLWQCALAVFLYCHGLSMNAIAKMFSVSPSTILRWIRKFGEQHLQLPEPETDATVVVELDEMWHYLKKTKVVDLASSLS